MLPGRDGLSVVRELGKKLYCAGAGPDGRSALERPGPGPGQRLRRLSAKPFAFDELLPPARPALRASQRRPPAATPVCRTGSRSGHTRREPEWTSDRIDHKEYALLELLLRHPGQVYTRTANFESIWGYDSTREQTCLKSI